MNTDRNAVSLGPQSYRVGASEASAEHGSPAGCPLHKIAELLTGNARFLDKLRKVVAAPHEPVAAEVGGDTSRQPPPASPSFEGASAQLPFTTNSDEANFICRLGKFLLETEGNTVHM